MIIYNVTIKVNHEIATEWVNWMKNEHIPDLMLTGLFADYRLCKMLELDEEDGITFSAQYFCNSRENYDAYIKNHAEMMRNKGIRKFGDKFIAFRSLMEVVS